MVDGTVQVNPDHRSANVVEPDGPTDPVVTTMLVEHQQANPIAVWSNLSLHYVGTDGENVIPADYYGQFAELEQ